MIHNSLHACTHQHREVSDTPGRQLSILIAFDTTISKRSHAEVVSANGKLQIIATS